MTGEIDGLKTVVAPSFVGLCKCRGGIGVERNDLNALCPHAFVGEVLDIVRISKQLRRALWREVSE